MAITTLGPFGYGRAGQVAFEAKEENTEAETTWQTFVRDLRRPGLKRFTS